MWIHAAAAGHIFTERDVPVAPVALVLGAKVDPDGRPSPFLTARLDLARRLYDSGKVKVLLVSGDHMRWEYDEPGAMRRWLVERGVPERRIVVDYAGFDTSDSCARADGVGDDSVKGFSTPWRVSSVRETGAAVKATFDVVVLLIISVGAPLAYALAMPLTRGTDAVISPSGVPYDEERDHPERIWWLLAASPFVLVADAPPATPTVVERSGDVIVSKPADLLGGMAELAREARQPSAEDGGEPEDYAADWPVWPLGLVVHGAIGAAAVVATVGPRHR